MQYRTNPKNGDKISILGYGCMRFSRTAGVAVNQKKAEEEMETALEAGVNYFDTAYVYPGSEEALGKFLAKGHRSRVFLATKLPHYQCRRYEDFERLFSEQLKRLETDYIDYYLIHMLSDTDSWQRVKELGIEKWISEKKSSGAIKNIGFSYHGGTTEFKAVLDCYPWDFCQIQLNYMDESTQAGISGLLYAGEKSLPVIIMEPLRGGRLANLPENAARHLPSGANQADLALRWLWKFPQVTCVLSGMNDRNQVRENVASACRGGELSDEESAALSSVKAELEADIQVPCTGCGYCMPCPKGVMIPSCFAAYNQAFYDGRFAAVFTYVNTTGMGKRPGFASQCIKCGRCEKHCPQHILIRDELENAAAVLEGPLFKIGRRGARLVFKMRE
ncbi:MAG TPA: aldo/keto reductase [Methanocorpusculum sp.]|nr:aldo/keto reductase [Methanocorpusculum sp.]